MTKSCERFLRMWSPAASTTTPDVGVYLLKNFGWDEENFRQEVLKPALLEQHVGVGSGTRETG